MDADGDDPDDGAEAAPVPAAAPVRAWGCGLAAGIAFAAFFGAGWMGLVAPQACVEGFPCTVYRPWAGSAVAAAVALVSGLYAVAVWAAVRRRPAAGRRRRPPLWAVLTGLTVIAAIAGGWLVWAVTMLASRTV